MTPKEKADELVTRMLTEHKQTYEGAFIGYREAKQCALISIDEILKEWSNEGGRSAKQKYWQEVKQEIEKFL